MKKALPFFTVALFAAALLVNTSVGPNGKIHFIMQAKALPQLYIPVEAECLNQEGDVYGYVTLCSPGPLIRCTPVPCAAE